MKSKITAVFAALSMSAVALATSPVFAQPAPAAAAAALTQGEIKKVDTEQGKVTIKHEAIQNLDMPAMTMVFKADKPELLASVEAGDKVQFRAESSNGALVVTQLQAAK